MYGRPAIEITSGILTPMLPEAPPEPQPGTAEPARSALVARAAGAEEEAGIVSVATGRGGACGKTAVFPQPAKRITDSESPEPMPHPNDRVLRAIAAPDPCRRSSFYL